MKRLASILLLAAIASSAFASSATVPAGSNVTIGVTANGTTPFFYQWRKNGIVINPGQNGATLNFPSAQPDDSGAYSVIVSNAAGATTSDIGTLIVTPPPATPSAAVTAITWTPPVKPVVIPPAPIPPRS